MPTPTSDLVSMAQQFTGLPMDSLIGAPLNAAAEANAAMAMTQTKFMLDTCFKVPDTPDGNLEPILIVMSLEKSYIGPPDVPGGDPTFSKVTTNLNLPLLTIIPLNSLAVDDVNITFEMEVKSSYGEDTSKEEERNISASAEWEVKFGYGPISASIKGNASYDSKDSSSFSTHYEKSNSAKYTVSVHAGQLPLSKGVNTIIEAYTRSIVPAEMPM